MLVIFFFARVKYGRLLNEGWGVATEKLKILMFLLWPSILPELADC